MDSGELIVRIVWILWW